MLEKEKVTYYNGSCSSVALRQSNKTLVIPFDISFPDSDSILIEDKYGHRYQRDIALEQFLESSDKLFTMI